MSSLEFAFYFFVTFSVFLFFFLQRNMSSLEFAFRFFDQEGQVSILLLLYMSSTDPSQYIYICMYVYIRCIIQSREGGPYYTHTYNIYAYVYIYIYILDALDKAERETRHTHTH
jgi:hypothetical protein